MAPGNGLHGTIFTLDTLTGMFHVYQASGHHLALFFKCRMFVLPVPGQLIRNQF